MPENVNSSARVVVVTGVSAVILVSMAQGLWTVLQPSYFLHAAMHDRLITQQDVDDIINGTVDGVRKGVVMAGLRATDISVNSRYARAVMAALDDRDVIGAAAVHLCFYN